MALFDFVSSSFGRLGGLFNKKNSYKYFFDSKYTMYGRKGALWIDVDAPYDIYNTVPQIRAVISKKALMFANMELKLVDKTDRSKVVDDEEFYKLMQQPNILQSMNEWLRDYKSQEQVYGNQFMYKNKPSKLTKYPISLSNISPLYIKPQLTGKTLDQVSLDGIITGYKYCRGDEQRNIKADDVLWSRIADLNDPLVGVSPIKSLKFPVSNTKASYEYLNVISTEKGAIGVLANISKDASGAIPLTPNEKKNIEEQYSKDYGLSEEQRKVILTNASLQWQPMSYPTKDLLLMEQIDSYALTIIDYFGLNVNIFSSKSSTYENVKNAIKLCYQDTIIPEADQFAQKLSGFLLQKDSKTEVIASFDHIGFLQDAKAEGIGVIQAKVNAITQMIQFNIIDAGTARRLLANELGIDLNSQI